MLNDTEAYLLTVYGCLTTTDSVAKKGNNFEQYNPIKEIMTGMENCHEFPTFPQQDIATRQGNARLLMRNIPNYILALNMLKPQYRASYAPINLVKVFNKIDDNIHSYQDIIDYIGALYERRNVELETIDNKYEQAAIAAYQMYYADGQIIPEQLDFKTISSDYNRLYHENIDFNDYLNGATHPGFGSHRDQNQDAHIEVDHKALPDTKLMVVADGVGGARNSEIVSKYFCEYLAKWFNSLESIDEKTFVSELEAEIKKADIEIEAYCNNNSISGSTVASVVVSTPTKTYVTSVGDTRVYLVKDDKLSRVVRPESSYEKRIAYGLPILESVSLSKRRPSGYIGYGCDNFGYCDPDTQVFDTANLDGVLMMTDGIYKETSDNEIETIIQNCDPDDVASEVVNLSSLGALSKKYETLLDSHADRGYDNATAVYYQLPKLKKYSVGHVKKISL